MLELTSMSMVAMSLMMTAVTMAMRMRVCPPAPSRQPARAPDSGRGARPSSRASSFASPGPQHVESPRRAQRVGGRSRISPAPQLFSTGAQRVGGRSRSSPAPQLFPQRAQRVGGRSRNSPAPQLLIEASRVVDAPARWADSTMARGQRADAAAPCSVALSCGHSRAAPCASRRRAPSRPGGAPRAEPTGVRGVVSMRLAMVAEGW